MNLKTRAVCDVLKKEEDLFANAQVIVLKDAGVAQYFIQEFHEVS